MKLRVIKCDFGSIMKKKDVKEVTVEDFENLRKQVSKYAGESTNNFKNKFCDIVLEELNPIMKELTPLDKKDLKICQLDYLNLKKFKELAKKIEGCSSDYIKSDTNSMGMLKLKHLVSSQRINQVKKLKELCSQISKIELKNSQKDKYKKELESETKEIIKFSNDINNIKNYNNEFGAGTLVNKKAMECFEKCIDNVVEATRDKQSDFHTYVLLMKNSFERLLKPCLEKIINMNSGHTDDSPLVIPDEDLKKKFLNACDDISTKAVLLQDYRPTDKKNEGEEIREFDLLNQARVNLMRSIEDIVNDTRNHSEWWEPFNKS